ncbi:MAG: aminotransferase class V-fold PLP-dependent enzyme [Planctomyces sp.]
MLTPESRRRDFPSLESRTYLNSAAEGIPPLVVQTALDQYFQDKLLGMDGRVPHFEQLEQVKRLTAEFYGLTADETAVCSCSSEACNLFTMALRLNAGDEVVINDLDFPAAVTPFLQQGSPAKVRLWKSRSGVLDIADLIPLLSSRTRLVTTSLVSFLNGYLINLEELRGVVRKHSAALLSVDVTQALGRIPLDLTDIDFVFSSTHKWILAGHGGGLVGVPAKRAAELTVPAGGWFHIEDVFGPKRFEAAVSRPGAPGFAVGMPNFPAIYAIRAALEYIRNVGVASIATAAEPLVRQCIEGLASLPVELLTPKSGPLAGIIAFRHSRSDEIFRQLHEKNIHIMANAGRLRVAIHGYNTAADVDRFLSSLSVILNAL